MLQTNKEQTGNHTFGLYNTLNYAILSLLTLKSKNNYKA